MNLNPRSWFRPEPPAILPDLIRTAARGYEREADLARANRLLTESLMDLKAMESLRIREDQENDRELEESLMMAQPFWKMPGPGAPSERLLREATGISAQGAYGDIELALQNVDWRREINGSWLEFSRWGIQQIMLISRLYYVKNPMIQRLINVSATYVFGRGVEITSTDESANDEIKAFLERNKRVFGQVALTDLDRRKRYDGNIFWALQTDTANTGEVNVRTIDALEIQEIICDPDDTETPQLYRRQWVQKTFDYVTGAEASKVMTAWYPALGYEPTEKPATIGGAQVRWDIPVYHRKCGGPAKWKFGIPLVYAALDWAKAQRKMLESFATIRQSLAQISMTLTTKGGQQALQGVKQQLSTTVGPSASLWDQNPTAVDGSIFASGPGTKLEAFNTSGAGGNPSDCREYKLMVAMVGGVPESFFADMNTSNLATATSLDRPTELHFTAQQEEWREDLSTLITYALKASVKAPSGKLREAFGNREMVIREARRVRNSKGNLVYEAATPTTDITVQVNFPTIIESDVPAQVQAIVAAYMGGQGIDQKEAVRLLGQQVGIENNEEVLEEQYPSDGPNAYNQNRTEHSQIMQKAAQQNALTPKPAFGKPGDGKPVKESRPEVKTLQEAAARLARAVQMLKAAEEDADTSRS
jgi:hypothetical protein